MSLVVLVVFNTQHLVLSTVDEMSHTVEEKTDIPLQ